MMTELKQKPKNTEGYRLKTTKNFAKAKVVGIMGKFGTPKTAMKNEQ